MATFSDNFNRTNSNTVGNGWSEIEVGGEDAAIVSNRLAFEDPAAFAVINRARTSGFGRNNTTIIYTIRFGNSVSTNENFVSTGHDGSSRGGAGDVDNGLHLYIDGTNITIYDGNTLKQQTAHSVSMSVDTNYYIRWDIVSDNSMRVYVRAGDANFEYTDIKATQAAFTQASASYSNWAIGGGAGGGSKTVYFDDVTIYDSVQDGPFTITTQAVSDTSGTPDGNGTIADANASSILQRGFVYHTSTLGDPGNVSPGSSSYSLYVSTSGTYSNGAFSIELASLNTNTTYYVRAFAQNAAGYQYGDEVSFTSPQMASVTTNAVTNVGAVGDGNATVTTTGGLSVTQRGFVFDTISYSNPGSIAPASTNYDLYVSESGTFGVGSFSLSLTGRADNSTIYVRSFIQNSFGYVYGDEVSYESGATPILYRWFPNGEGVIRSMDQLANQGDVYTIVRYLPSLSTVRNMIIYCAPTESADSTVIATLKFYKNQQSTPFMTKSVTQEMASRGYVSVDLNTHNVNAIQVEIEFNTTSTLGNDDFCPSIGILDYEPTKTHTPSKD